MMISKIKDYVNTNKGKEINFRLNNGRNQIVNFKGIIISVHQAIFTVKLLDSDVLKSFSYTDILIGNLVINA